MGKPNCYTKAMKSQQHSKQSGTLNALPKKRVSRKAIYELAQLKNLAVKFVLKEPVDSTWTSEATDTIRNWHTSHAFYVLGRLHSLPSCISMLYHESAAGSLVACRTRIDQSVRYGIKVVTNRTHILLLNKSPRHLLKLENGAGWIPKYKRVTLNALVKLQSQPKNVDMLERRGLLVSRKKTGKKRITYSAYITRRDTFLTLQSFNNAKLKSESEAVRLSRKSK